MHSESVKYGEKMASVCFKLRNMILEHHNHAFLFTAIAMSIDSAHSMHNACRACASCLCAQLSTENVGYHIAENFLLVLIFI